MFCRYEVGSHVLTVEFHVYLYHLLDTLPDWDLPKHPGLSNGFNLMELEDLQVELTFVDGGNRTYQNLKFPKRFSDVLDFYLYDLEPIFFPSYEYHILSKSGVVLRHALLQTCRHEPVTSFIPELMLNVEMAHIKTIKWQIGRGISYLVELTEVVPLPAPRALLPTPVAPKKAIRTRTGIDLRPLCPPIKNQGDLGTCGVMALTTLLEFVTGKPLSVNFLYYTTRVYICNFMPHDDAGVEIEHLFEALSTYGQCRNEAWPYNAAKFLETPPPSAFEEALNFKPIDFTKLSTLEDMKNTLNRELPIVIDILFAPDAYGRGPEKTGYVSKPPTTEVEYCDHSVVLVGYDDTTENLIVQNSWGTYWGHSGFGYVPYEYINRGLFKNAYTWKNARSSTIHA